MRRIVTAGQLAIVMLFAVLSVMPILVAAQEEAEQELEDPGLLPDNFFYGFKRFWEGLRMFFTFNENEKVKLKIQFAGTRLAEARHMMLRNNTESANQLMEEYQEQMQEAEQDTVRLKLRNITVDDIDEYMNQTTSKHISVLERVLEKAPESAKPGLQNALNNAVTHQEKVRERLEEKIRRRGGTTETTTTTTLPPTTTTTTIIETTTTTEAPTTTTTVQGSQSQTYNMTVNQDIEIHNQGL